MMNDGDQKRFAFSDSRNIHDRAVLNGDVWRTSSKTSPVLQPSLPRRFSASGVAAFLALPSPKLLGNLGLLQRYRNRFWVWKPVVRVLRYRSANQRAPSVAQEGWLECSAERKELSTTAAVFPQSFYADPRDSRPQSQRLKRHGSQKVRKEATLVLEDDRVESSLWERIVVGCALALGCTALGQVLWDTALLLSNGKISSEPRTAAVQLILEVTTAIIAFAVADLVSGIYHFFLDNYGSRETPVFGAQIVAFQGHHQFPWTITHRDWCNNVYKSCAMSLLPLTLVAACGETDASTDWLSINLRLFGVVFLLSVAFAQEFHKWSHMIRPPPAVRFLQRSGWLISQREHGQHHQSPYHEKYCIVSGWCNRLLDETHFFRHLEYLVWRLTGAEPLTWRLGVGKPFALSGKAAAADGQPRE